MSVDQSRYEISAGPLEHGDAGAVGIPRRRADPDDPIVPNDDVGVLYRLFALRRYHGDVADPEIAP